MFARDEASEAPPSVVSVPSALPFSAASSTPSSSCATSSFTVALCSSFSSALAASGEGEASLALTRRRSAIPSGLCGEAVCASASGIGGGVTGGLGVSGEPCASFDASSPLPSAEVVAAAAAAFAASPSATSSFPLPSTLTAATLTAVDRVGDCAWLSLERKGLPADRWRGVLRPEAASRLRKLSARSIRSWWGVRGVAEALLRALPRGPAPLRPIRLRSSGKASEDGTADDDAACPPSPTLPTESPPVVSVVVVAAEEPSLLLLLRTGEALHPSVPSIAPAEPPPSVGVGGFSWKDTEATSSPKGSLLSFSSSALCLPSSLASPSPSVFATFVGERAAITAAMAAFWRSRIGE